MLDVILQGTGGLTLQTYEPAPGQEIGLWPQTEDGLLIDKLQGPVCSRPSLHPLSDRDPGQSPYCPWADLNLRCAGEFDFAHDGCNVFKRSLTQAGYGNDASKLVTCCNWLDGSLDQQQCP